MDWTIQVDIRFVLCYYKATINELRLLMTVVRSKDMRLKVRYNGVLYTLLSKKQVKEFWESRA